MYINRPKTKMNCILVFFNYHGLLLSLAVCLHLWAFVLQVESKCNLPCDYTCELAESHSIYPLSIYATTSSSLIQGFPLTLLSSSPIMMTGSSLSLKDTNCLCALRIPWSPLMPKSGNVCGRHYMRALEYGHWDLTLSGTQVWLVLVKWHGSRDAPGIRI